MKPNRWAAAALVSASLIAYASTGAAKQLEITTPLPDAVDKTYRTVFPKGEITRLDASEENGVTVYDIEFDDGPIAKEIITTPEGKVVEPPVWIDPNEAPKP